MRLSIIAMLVLALIPAQGNTTEERELRIAENNAEEIRSYEPQLDYQIEFLDDRTGEYFVSWFDIKTTNPEYKFPQCPDVSYNGPVVIEVYNNLTDKRLIQVVDWIIGCERITYPNNGSWLRYQCKLIPFWQLDLEPTTDEYLYLRFELWYTPYWVENPSEDHALHDSDVLKFRVVHPQEI
jgi:hypothetical protein